MMEHLKCYIVKAIFKIIAIFITVCLLICKLLMGWRDKNVR